MRTINFLVLHCTATPQTTTIAQIESYWKNVLNWKNKGYHFIVEPNGRIHNVTPIESVANGVKNHNLDSIHIAYIGGVDRENKPIDNRTFDQKNSLNYILRKLICEFPDAEILGHRDFKGVNKACPCFDAKKEYHDVLDLFG